MGDQFYFDTDRTLPSGDEVAAFIDRRIYLDVLMTDAKAVGLDLVAGLNDPATVFSTPSQLVAGNVSDRLKTEILRRRAFVEKERDIVSDAEMAAFGYVDSLREIQIAMVQLEVKQDALKTVVLARM